MQSEAHTVRPLSGLKVVDASSVIAGPLAAMFLGDYGADVVKIEPPEHGDPMRDHGPYADGVPLWWKMLGRNKHSVRCDLRSPEGRDRFRAIAAEADVVILAFRPSTLERWELTPEQLRELNPRLVVGCISGYGDRGPLADAGGFGTMAESMSGFTHRNGFPDGPPTLPPFGLADGSAGLSLAMGICVALLGRHTSGTGQVVRVSLVDPLLTILAPQNALYYALGTVAGRIGNRSAASAPRNLYACGDGRYLAISCSTFSTAKALMDLIGRPEVAAEPWFYKAFGRAEHVDELDEMVNGWLKSKTHDEALGLLRAAAVPVAPVNDAAMIATDPQLLANESLVVLPDSQLGTVCMPNVIAKLSDTPGAIHWSGQELGGGEAEVATWGGVWSEIATEPPGGPKSTE